MGPYTTASTAGRESQQQIEPLPPYTGLYIRVGKISQTLPPTHASGLPIMFHWPELVPIPKSIPVKGEQNCHDWFRQAVLNLIELANIMEKPERTFWPTQQLPNRIAWVAFKK